MPTSTHQPEMLVCSPARAGGGWELRLGLWSSDPRERTGVGWMNTAWRGLVHHNQWGGSPGKCLELPERQETIVSGCVRRGASWSMCPQTAEHHLSKLQRWAWATAIISYPRGKHGLLPLPPLLPRVLCTNAGHYPHPPGSLCSMPLPGARDPRPNSLGEHMTCLRLLQPHAGLCHRRHSPQTNYDYCTPPYPWPEWTRRP